MVSQQAWGTNEARRTSDLVAEIELSSVTKVFPDGTQAVNAVSLSIADGSLVVLVGPSGCGKTTLLRMVAGLETITTGTVRIGDRVVNGLRPRDRDVAMVFQNYALYPHMSVYENMGFSLKLRRVSRSEIDRRVQEAARALGLTDQLLKRPVHLSGGQRQRVAMGRAIVREPQVFLMDEPLSNLDAKLRVQMRAEIGRIQRAVGVTTIYVTHDQTEAMTLGDSVAVMRRGVLQQVDRPQVLFQRPRNLFVAGFIGSPAMNIVEATLTAANGVICVEFGGMCLEVDSEAVAKNPALTGWVGQKVVLGIRPESIEDATIAATTPENRQISAVVDLREEMGSEAFVYFSLNVPPVLTDETRELAEDIDADTLTSFQESAAEMRTNFVARLNSRSVASEGERVTLAVDTRALYFFDPKTGENINQPQT